jgi:hypothetical protein
MISHNQRVTFRVKTRLGGRFPRLFRHFALARLTGSIQGPVQTIISMVLVRIETTHLELGNSATFRHLIYNFHTLHFF